MIFPNVSQDFFPPAGQINLHALVQIDFRSLEKEEFLQDSRWQKKSPTFAEDKNPTRFFIAQYCITATL